MTSRQPKSKKSMTKHRTESESGPPSKEPKDTEKKFPIVGIGASAGGLGPAKEFFKNIPADIGMAFVFIQHMDPKATSNLADIFSGVANLPVTSLHKDVKVASNNIYVMTPGTCLRLEKQRIKILSREVCEDGVNKPVDVFLRSLAEEWGNKAIAIILSGMGSDGTLGLQAIRAEGGITYAQDEKSAVHASMPAHAAATGSVDFVLPPEKIAEELITLSRHPFVHSATSGSSNSSSEGSLIFEKIYDLIKRKHRIDFSQYKQTTVKRRIERRMVVHKLKTTEEYLDFLQSHNTEIEALYHDTLINVTQFFRNPETFTALKNEVFPKIIKNDHSRQPIRIWVPGCSTGEEAYSIMIVLSEFLEDKSLGTDIQLFASDVSPRVIEKARAGFFPENISLDVSTDRLRRFFVRSGNGYQVSKSIRDSCIFAVQNVTADPPFSKVDLISCRNLLIYFSINLQKQVLPMFHYALNTDGFLLLGASEGVSGSSALFSCVNKKNNIFSKNIVANKSSFKLPVNFPNQTLTTASSEVFQERKPKDSNMKDIASRADRFIANQFGPPGFVVNENMDILQIRGDTSPFVELSPGTANFNLHKFLKQELRSPLRALFLSVKNTGVSEAKPDIRLKGKDDNKEIVIHIAPLKAPSSEQFTYLIYFTEKAQLSSGVSKKLTVIPKVSREERDIEFRQMAEELSETKQHLDSITEQMETTNEELKSSNEELLSANEELQSTNEEFQTANEEIQSSNEELNTLNEELQNRNSQISCLNDDLTNLLRSTQNAVVMVGSDLRIRRFTSPAKKLLRLIATDVGRPIRDIRPALKVESLEKLAEDVIKDLQPKNMEVQAEDDHWYLMQFRPYRTVENKIEGVVLTFVDIHDLKLRLEQERYLATIVRDSPDAITAQDFSGNILAWNHGAEKMYGYSKPEALKMNISQLVPENLKSEALAYIDKIAQHENISSFETQRLSKDGRILDVWLTVTALTDDSGQPTGVCTTERDITLRNKVEKDLIEAKQKAESANFAKSEFLANMSHEIRTPICAIMGFSEIIARGSCSENDRIDHAQRIITNAENLKRLIDDILDLSKIESGKIQLEMREFPLLTELNDIFCGLRILAEAKGIALEVSAKSKLPESIVSDSGILRQILMNVVGNAIKFTSRGSVLVQIRSKQKTNKEPSMQLEFIVKDTGCGISEEQTKNIFEPFVQAEESSKRSYGGTGLGLSLSTKLAKVLGGQIKLVESTLGKGSEFSIAITSSMVGNRILTSDEANESLLPKSLEKPRLIMNKGRLKKVKVLVAEDNLDLQELMGNYLKRSEAEVDFAKNGLVAIEKVKENSYDIVLMDMSMPIMNGYEATTQIRKNGYKGPIIAVSARVMKDEVSKSFDVGCTECVGKPVSYDRLISVIEKHVKKSPDS